ncbi:uncharacterized protein N7511_009509 [Penicillium nucicola]|uniref:uncharacterized protein n=1 Tax=Penicillium nucicola TaxID=1850975 RepID=UPI00254588B5|nr:uncharacterized protein N7511_009509 [Penicillium nucicola]KAJ5747813.1 hypothetical protein N7511_009509 [Penicillium nucicola]
MTGRNSTLLTWMLFIWLYCSITLFLGALAFNCSSFVIYSPAGADLLRKNCPVITGHVAIGPLNDNSTTQHINLDGVEVIEGTLGGYWTSIYDTLDTQPYFTLSSSTLTEVGAIEFGSSPTKLQNLTLPNLKTVDTGFSLGHDAPDMTYLDIANLESVSYFTLSAPNITTFRHKSLRNATSVQVYATKIDSLDILSDSRLNLSAVYISGPLPNLNSLTFGFLYVDDFSIYANSSVTLGSPSATNMTIGTLSLAGGVSDLKRSPKLASLKADSLLLSSDISIPHLEIPFDDLRYLKLEQFRGTHPVQDITLPPQAVNWTGGFDVQITGPQNLNLTSMYRTNDQNKRVQTWYWPTNISSISISGCLISNAFFDTFVAQQNSSLNSTPPPSVLTSFSVYPSKNSTDFNCAPFQELLDKGRLLGYKSNLMCSNSTKSSGSTLIDTPSPLRLAGVAALGAAMWMV